MQEAADLCRVSEASGPKAARGIDSVKVTLIQPDQRTDKSVPSGAPSGPRCSVVWTAYVVTPQERYRENATNIVHEDDTRYSIRPRE